jgi:hypothetical protein
MMNTSPINNHHPLFGWNVTNPINLDGSTGNAKLFFDSTGSPPEDMISSRVQRDAGVHRVGVFGSIAVGDWVPAIPTPSTNTVNLILEGSNDGLESDSGLVPRNVNDHWVTISELDIGNYFDNVATFGGAQLRQLGVVISQLGTLIGDPNIDVSRFKYLRVRIAVNLAVIPAPIAVSVSAVVSAIGGDNEGFERDYTISRGASNPATDFAPFFQVRSGAQFERPAGTRWMTVQGVADLLTIQAPTVSYGAILQGTFDGFENTASWFTIASILAVSPLFTGFTTQGQSIYFQRGTKELIDMDPYQHFRVLTYENIAPGNPTADVYDLRFIFEFDGGDILNVEDVSTSDFNADLRGAFYKVQFGTPGTQAGSGIGATIDIPFQVLDISGQPIREPRALQFSVATNTSDAAGIPQGRFFDGIISPQTNYFPTVAGTTTNLARLNSLTGLIAAIAVRTDGTGQGTIRITQNVAGPGSCWLWPNSYTQVNGISGVQPGSVLISSADTTGLFRGQIVTFVP